MATRIKRPDWHLSRWAWLRTAVYERDDFTCQHCQWRPDDEKISAYEGRRNVPSHLYYDESGRLRGIELNVDHRIPIVSGGTNDLDNLQTLCSRCNQRKGVR